jgi:hypothetical protein
MRRHHVARLVRIQREDVPVQKLGRALLNMPDVCVSCFHRGGEVPRLEGRPHPLIFARRHATLEDERFGSTADAAVQRADEDFVR